MIKIEDLKSEYRRLQKQYPNKSHIFLEGTEKLFLSAPHATHQTRNGVTKFSETETAYVCLYLNKFHNIPCIIKLHNKNDDANYDIECEYKDDLINNINQYNPSLFIDLHEMKNNRYEDICFGTADDNNSNLLNLSAHINNFIDCFNLFKVIEINVPFKANTLHTNAYYISSKLGVPSMQIEISSRHLSDFRNATYFDFEKIIKSLLNLNEYINKL